VVESVLVVGDQVVDAAELDGWHLAVSAGDDTKPRMLLAHFTITEDGGFCISPQKGALGFFRRRYDRALG
jgi:hypothetical protein